MSDKVIIDGVDVSGCEDLTHQLCCEQYLCEECEGQDCYYKQLQQLKAENHALRQSIKDINIIRLSEKYTQYKQALEEVREIASPHCSQCREIINKINEVLKDERN